MAASAQSRHSYRWATPSDYEELGRIMYDSIHATPSPYSLGERNAWCPAPPNGEKWQARLDSQCVAVALDQDRLVGLMTLAPSGYLDLAFIRQAARGQGHLRKLFDMIRQRAKDLGLETLSSHASLAAQSPFQTLGFTVIQHETVERAGENLRRAEMQLFMETTGPIGSIR